jgi:uncharacterized protein YggE
MNPRKRSSLTILLPAFLFLSLALLGPTLARAQDRTVSASAEASLQVPNDTAGVGFAVAVERRSRGAALGGASSELRGVLAAVGRVPGVGPGDVTTGPVSVDTVGRGGRTRFRATERVDVVLHAPRRAGALVGAALAAGASRVNGPFYFLADPETAFVKVLGLAFDRARARAAALAAHAGGALGAVISVDEGEGPVLAPAADGFLAGEEAPKSPVPVKPGRSTVSAYVHVVFALQ